MSDNSGKKREQAIEQLAEFLSLTPDAIALAEGWSILPSRMQRHFKLLIDDYIAELSPVLKELYANANPRDQQRFNAIIERIQADKRNRR